MSKKILSILTALIIILSGSFVYADDIISEDMENSEDIKLLTLVEARRIARENIGVREDYEEIIRILEELDEEQKSKLGEKYFTYDHLGNEVVNYRHGEIDYDYETDLERFRDSLDSIKDENERKAIEAYSNLLQNQLEIRLKEFDLDLKNMDYLIAKRSYENGVIYKSQLEAAEKSLEAANLELQISKSQLEDRFIRLNIILGFDRDARYELDKESLVVKVEGAEEELFVPQDAIELAFEQSKLISDLREEIEKTERALASMNRRRKIYDEKEIDYRFEKENLEIEEFRLVVSIENQKTALLIDLADLNQIIREKDLANYLMGIDEVKYSVGLISKRDYIESMKAGIEAESRYLGAVMNTYKNILSYNRNFEKNPGL